MEIKEFKVKGNVCATTPPEISQAGKFIEAGEAKTRLDNYFKVTGLSRTDPKVIFGQLFGLENMRLLIKQIDDYNKGLSAGDKHIVAVRIYNAMSVRDYLPAPDNTALLADTLLVPVLETGDDYPDINKRLLFPDLVLSDGRPCPNECGKGLHHIKV